MEQFSINISETEEGYEVNVTEYNIDTYSPMFIRWNRLAVVQTIEIALNIVADLTRQACEQGIEYLFTEEARS